MRYAPLGPQAVGKTLAKTVYALDGRPLLKSGTMITDEYIEALARWGYEGVYIQDEFFPDLPVDADISEGTRILATSSLREAVEAMNRQTVVDVSRLSKVIESMLRDLEENRSALYHLSVIKTTDDLTYQHSINVTILSLLLGLAGHLSKENLLKLGIGALLHDVGKSQIPREILLKPGKLTPEEYEVAKEHALLGFQMLSRTADGLSPLSMNMALSHHERLDGSGYPRQIKGDEIHPFSRIGAVADVWDALVSKRLYKEEWSPSEAADYFLSTRGRLYDDQVVGHLLERMAIYPTGSIVRLNDGRLGIIRAQNPGDGSHPTVVILADRQNRLLEPYELDWTWESEAGIKSVLNDYPVDIRRLLEKKKKDQH